MRKTLSVVTPLFHWDVHLFGSGNCTWVAFAGFGETEQSFLPIVNLLPPNHQLVCINHPLHGQSKASDFKTLSPLSIEEYTAEVIEILKVLKVDTFGLMGYSLGGRLATTLSTTLHSRVQKMILIAPDGFQKNVFHYLGKIPVISRWIFNYFRKNPKFIIQSAHLLQKWGFISADLLKFSSAQILSSEKRNQLYITWFVLNNVFPKVGRWIKLGENSKLPVQFYLGSKDPVIKSRIFQKLEQRKSKEMVFTYLPLRHRIMDHPQFLKAFDKDFLQLED